VPFLKWACNPPGSRKEWMVGVRVVQTRKLVAFISCTPAELYAHNVRVQPHHAPAKSAAVVVVDGDANDGEGGGQDSGEGSVSAYGEASGSSAGKGGVLAVDVSNDDGESGGGSAGSAAAATAAGEVEAEESADGATVESGLVEVNFLCVHKKLRSKRLAPVLIREITRRVNCRGLFQAAYTAGVVLPKPVARCRYWHRSLNPKKLIEVGFSRLAPRMTITRTIKLYALPDAPQTRGLRPIREADVAVCCSMLNTFLRQFVLAPQMTVPEFRHWLLTQVCATLKATGRLVQTTTRLFHFAGQK